MLARSCARLLFLEQLLNPANMLLKSCVVNIARFLKYVWSFFNIAHERVNTEFNLKC